MIATGEIIYEVQDMINDASDETRVKILRVLNSVYYHIAAKHLWYALTKNINMQGSVLPGDLERIVYLQDDTSQLYFPISFKQRYFSQKLYNYFSSTIQALPIVTGSDMSANPGIKTVTSMSSTFTSALAGEYIKIGTNRGIYKIASVTDANNLVLSDAFRGDAATAQYFEIRPQGTKQISETDDHGSAITSSTIMMWYLQKPLPLYNDTDPILFPGGCEAVRIAVLKRMMVTEKYDNDSLKQDNAFQEAYDAMVSLEPIPDTFISPRDKFGMKVMFGRTRAIQPVGIHSERYW